MIINDLYANGTEYWTGSSYQQYKDIMAQFAGQVGIDTYSPDAYWLGWISKDNIPVLDRSAHCTVDDGICTFEEDIDDANFPITYAYYFDSSGNVYQNNEIVHNENGSNYNQFRFINQMYPEYSALYAYTNWQLYGRAMIYDAGENLVSYRQSFSHGSITTNPANIFTNIGNFIKFYEYGGTMQISFGSTYGTITITSDDFRNGTFYVESTTGYFIRGFFTSYSFPGYYYITHQNDHSRLQYFYPFVSITCNSDGITQYSRAIRGARYNYNNIATLGSNGTFSWVYDNSTYGNKPLGRDRAGMHGTIDTNLLTSVNPYMWDGNVLCILDMYDQEPHTAKYFFPIITMDDVYKTLALNFRVDVRTYTNGYVNGSTYATDVTPDNEFLAKLKTGDIENPEFKNSLRPWQYENFQENDFTEEDVPPYEPEPEPGGDTPSEEPEDMPHDEGDPAGLQDRTIPAPSLFITQYALTYEDVQAVGANLWQSWLTPNTDVWKNFFLPYGQDFGTLNIGAALDCIISLRAYPFELPLDVLLPAANGVRMGTGHTDFLGNGTFKVNASTCKIPLGDCVVKPKTPYEDFRDMYNTSVSCFLPYCGTVELNPPEVMNRTLHCYYCIDFQSGGCTAFITLDGDEGEYIIASKSGQIGFLLPITATNAGQLAAQKGQDAVETIGTLAGFFFDVAGELAQSSENAIKALAGIESGKSDKDSVPIGTTLTSSLKIGESGVNTGLALANQALKRLSRSGVGVPAISGGSGIEAIYAPDTAVISIRRGKYAKPINYPHSQAHLNGSSGKIETFKGDWGKYTPKTGKGLCKFTGVDTTGLKCHDDERAEIVALLESGVYI